MEIAPTSHLQHLDTSVLNLCRPCDAVTQSLIYLCISPVVFGRQGFLCIIPPLWLLHWFCLLFCLFLYPLVGGFDDDIPLRTCSFSAFHSLYIGKLWVSISSHLLQEKALLWWLRKALILGHHRMLFEVIYCCSFSIIAVNLTLSQ